MRRTLSLVAWPGHAIPWHVGDRVKVTFGEDEPRPYRVTYVDPNRISLELVT